MEFSDDSFVWCDASKDSDTMEFDKKHEESDNDRGDDTVLDRSHEKKKKAKKRKYEEPIELNGTVDIKPKLIKSEIESDFETPRKKKKKKHHNHTEELQESDHDESYLNHKVKQEQLSFLEPTSAKPKSKKKHKKTSEDLEDQRHEVETDNSKLSESSEIDSKTNAHEDVAIKKKKKSKKNPSDSITSNNDVADDIDNELRAKKKKKKKHEKEINSNGFDNTDDSQIEEISCIDNSTLNNHFIDDVITEKSNDDLNIKATKTDLKKNFEITSDTNSTKQVPKLSERLTFEEDNTFDSELKEIDGETKLSKQLRKFFNAHKNISLITPKSQTASVITEDDEIWLINGPHELNVKDFKGIHIKIDTKCKLKFNGQTYDSVIDNCVNKAPILSHYKNKLYVKNVPIVNTINLRKRIPKDHIPEENVIINKQISFIPLPETKCRHPLFGINYKKATKIPSSIMERLNNTEVEPLNSDREKRKKHKKEKRKVEIESEVETKHMTETIPEVSAKKKRKRKSSTKDEHVAKKAKHIKNEPDSTDVWDSEQAIERNLFDF